MNALSRWVAKAKVPAPRGKLEHFQEKWNPVSIRKYQVKCRSVLFPVGVKPL